MVEKIGVLAIDGIIGYRYALDKYAANKTIDDLTTRAVVCSQQMQKFATCDLGDFPEITVTGYPVRVSTDVNGRRFFLNITDMPAGI